MMLVRAIATESRGPRTRGGRTRESRHSGARGESTEGRAHGYCEASARRDDEGDPGVDRRGGATEAKPARPMRPSGCDGAGPSALLAALDDAHRHRLRAAA